MSEQNILKTAKGDRIAIVSGLRTPFAKQATAFHHVPALDMGKLVLCGSRGLTCAYVAAV